MEKQEYKVKQICPNHADHISGYKEQWLNELFERDAVIAQRKYDGERMLVHFNREEVYCTSRRHSKKTNRYMENQDRLVNLPHIDLDYTVIDCECYSRTWSNIAGILHSLPERAAMLQETIPVWFACFDCLFYDGQDIRHLPYVSRLEYLSKVLGKVLIQGDNRFHMTEWRIVNTLEEAYAYRDSLIDLGYEGCVIKSLNMAYYDVGASLKAKRFETVDVVVIDYQQGRGKYENTVGALIVGYYDGKDFVQISKVNCGTDEDRDWWRDNWSTARYSVIEVKCQEVTSRSLRHPVYVRKRDDKDYTMVTRNTIFKEEE